MNDEELKQVLLNTIQIGESQKINHLTVHEVVQFMKKNYDIKGDATNEVLKQLKYDNLISIKNGCVTYTGYKEKYPVIGE